VTQLILQISDLIHLRGWTGDFLVVAFLVEVDLIDVGAGFVGAVSGIMAHHATFETGASWGRVPPWLLSSSSSIWGRLGSSRFSECRYSSLIVSGLILSSLPRGSSPLGSVQVHGNGQVVVLSWGCGGVPAIGVGVLVTISVPVKGAIGPSGRQGAPDVLLPAKDVSDDLIRFDRLDCLSLEIGIVVGGFSLYHVLKYFGSKSFEE
jgi:hypothetical protein